jgi:HEAT repeat protein
MWRLAYSLVLSAGLLTAGCGGKVDADANRPVSYWLDEVKKPDRKARVKAVRRLGQIGGGDPAAVAAVTDALRDKEATVRQAAVLALENLGPAAASAVPALTEVASRDPDKAVRSDATKALEHIRGERR